MGGTCMSVLMIMCERICLHTAVLFCKSACDFLVRFYINLPIFNVRSKKYYVHCPSMTLPGNEWL